MKSLLFRSVLAVSLMVPAMALTACSDDATNVDDNTGKAISSLDIGGDITISEGDTKQMSATVEFADGTSEVVTTSSDLVWNIGNTSVATINETGVVTGVSKGATEIKATYQGKESDSKALIVH